MKIPPKTSKEKYHLKVSEFKKGVLVHSKLRKYFAEADFFSVREGKKPKPVSLVLYCNGHW